MKKRIGILTSGGDCPGLNAAIRGVAKASYELFDCEFIGIHDGYQGLIDGDYRDLTQKDFSGILTRGGTMLGTHRTPFKRMRKIEEDGVDKVANMVHNYEKLGLDCLVTLGGNGTHKNANLLKEEGLNVIGLPKTIDNDIYGTDLTFGFHSAVDIATEVIDRIHTTADSHDRVMIIELMGHKAGWLTLYAGLAGGADVVLIPEIPYSEEKIYEALQAHYPTMSRATVYKTINLLKKEGEVLELEFSDLGNRYDGNRPYPHPHVICTVCATITDPSHLDLDKITGKMMEETGFKIMTHRLDFYGLCPQCQGA